MIEAPEAARLLRAVGKSASVGSDGHTIYIVTIEKDHENNVRSIDTPITPEALQQEMQA